MNKNVKCETKYSPRLLTLFFHNRQPFSHPSENILSLSVYKKKISDIQQKKKFCTNRTKTTRNKRPTDDYGHETKRIYE